MVGCGKKSGAEGQSRLSNMQRTRVCVARFSSSMRSLKHDTCLQIQVTVRGLSHTWYSRTHNRSHQINAVRIVVEWSMRPARAQPHRGVRRGFVTPKR